MKRIQKYCLVVGLLLSVFVNQAQSQTIEWLNTYPKTDIVKGIWFAGIITLGGWSYKDANPQVRVEAWQSGGEVISGTFPVNKMQDSFNDVIANVTAGKEYNVIAEIIVTKGGVDKKIRTAVGKATAK